MKWTVPSGLAPAAERERSCLATAVKWTLVSCRLVQVSNSVTAVGAGKRLWLNASLAAVDGGKVMVSDNVRLSVKVTAVEQRHTQVDVAREKPRPACSVCSPTS